MTNRRAKQRCIGAGTGIFEPSRLVALRGKRDPPAGSVCSFAASTQTVTLSSSAHSETLAAWDEMLVLS